MDVDHQFTGTEPVAIGKDSYTTVGGLFISFLVEEIAERGRESDFFYAPRYLGIGKKRVSGWRIRYFVVVQYALQ